MVRIIIVALAVLCVGPTPTYSQIFGGSEVRDRGEPIFSPLKNIRDRAENGVISDKAKKVCDACKLKGKLLPEAACKRCQREKANQEEKEKKEKAKEAELKKLEAEAKKAELEAQLLEEEERKRNKPWDVADEENAELGELLKLAAAVKKDQDLAPKKQQALDYLASLGCSKDPAVAKAIMEGLKDFNVEVRKTAVQAVIYAAQGAAGFGYPEDEYYEHDPYASPAGACGCGSETCNARGRKATCKKRKRKSRYCKICGPKSEPQDKDCPSCDAVKKKKDAKAARKQKREQRRKDRVCGCGKSNCSGCDGMPCDIIGDGSCEACMEDGSDGCKSCCNSKIREELRKMAFEPDPKRPGCYYEPSLDVRNLALEAYNICPAVAKKKDDDIPEPLKGGSEGTTESEAEGSSEGEGEGAGSDMDDSLEPKLEKPSSDGENDSAAGSKIQEAGNSSEPKLENPSPDSENDSAGGSKMLRGRITLFSQQGYSMRHSSNYHIPTGNRLYISTNDHDGHVVQVVNSNAGMTQVKYVEGHFTGRTSAVRIGVMR